jgi:orotate phosphoribosyltransferase
MIEGDVESGQTVVVIEDLISTGGSSLKAVNALREKGCNVKGMVAIFTYGFDEAVKNFEEAKCTLKTLSNYSTLIDTAVNKNYINEGSVANLNEWRNNPAEWGKAIIK